MGFTTLRQPVSLRRVSLLLVLGLLVGLNFTRPGLAGISRGARALDECAVWDVPEWARHEPLDGRERARWSGLVWKAFHADEAEPEPGAEGMAPPMPDQIAERLGGLDGWDSAVMYLNDASPQDLYEAGLHDRVGCLRVMQRSGIGSMFRLGASGPLAWWHVVLLDEQGRELGRTIQTEITQGWELDHVEDGTPVYRRLAGWVEAQAPKAVYFRRGSQGVIRGA